MNKDWTIIGRFMGPFGIKGEVKLILESVDLEHLKKKKISLWHEKKDLLLTIHHYRQTSKQTIASFHEITDRTQAETLPKSSLWIDSKYLLKETPLPSLEGYSVYDTQKQLVGIVDFVENYGASDILEIKTVDQKEVSIPDIPSLILKISDRKKQIFVSDLFWDYCT